MAWSIRRVLLRCTTAAILGATAIGFTCPALAQVADEGTLAFDIPAGSLQSALAAFGSTTGWQLIYAPEGVSGRKVPRLRGRLTADAALRKLIVDTGLHIRRAGGKVVVLEPSSDRTSQTSSTRIPAVSGMTSGDQDVGADIVVTGSNIRGESPVGSHVQTVRRNDIERNGYGTVAQALQALPGNFGGTATEQSALSFADRTGTNTALATGVNLRGLGAAATLVLLNGRRIAGSGTLGDFADVSSIPMSVVDRVEVLMDGASAIYGSDAVGGVVNIVMKNRVNGLESGGRIGSATQGGLREIQAYQTAGTTWNSGSAFLTYEYYDRAALKSADRRFSRSADSRPLGGTDHRYIYSVPGNILDFDPATGGLNVTYAIPTGQDGKSLTASDFIKGGRNLEDFQIGTYLAPQQTRHSIYGMARQDIGDRVNLTFEGRFSHRNFDSRSAGYATILSIDRSNPWFVSPDGSSSSLLGYSFGREIGPTHDGGWSQSMGLTGAVDVDLSRWKVSAYGAYAQGFDFHRTDNLPNEMIIAEAMGSGDDPATAYSPARDGYFNPYGNGNANSPAVLAAIGSGFTEGRYKNRVSTGNIQADGPLASLPAGDIRLAVGANIRREVFQSRTTSFFYESTPTTSAPVQYGRTIGAAFAEARVPLFGPVNAQPGLRRLELSIAGRFERYPDFGSTANPKFGVSWSPLAGLTLRGTYGTSFRAPNLGQLREQGSVASTILTNATGAAVRVLQLAGGNPTLNPERARSWTLGADIAPVSLPGFHAQATLFHTLFDQRIDRPAARSFRTALVNPDLAPFVRFVSPGSNAADRAYVAGLLSSQGGQGSVVQIDTIAAVVDTRYVNSASTDVKGVDFGVGYSTEVGGNTISADANGTYLLAWRQQTTPTSVDLDKRNLSGWPTAFRGRGTVSWRRGPADALIGVSHVNAYRDAVTQARIGAWTTVDVRLGWAWPKGGLLGDATIALIAHNILDQDPPFYDSSAGVGYDAANSDATGRFIALQLTKRW